MPVIPSTDEVNRLTPQGSTSIVNVRAGTVQGAQAQAFAQKAQSALATAQGVGRLASGIGDIVAKEQDRLDRLKVSEAESALLLKLTDLTIGEKGYERSKQGDVLKPDYLKNHTANFDAATDEIIGKLSNDVQKEYFKGVAEKHKTGYTKGIMLHSMREAEAYQDTVYKGQVFAHSNWAKSQYDKPDAVIAGVEGVRAATLNHLAQKGITDPTLVESAVLEAVGQVHGEIIDSARRAGSIAYANEYLNAKRAEMTAEQVEAIEAKLKPATAFMEGSDIGDTAFAMKQEGKSAVEIQKFINAQTKDPDTRRAAQASMLELEQAFNKDLAEKSGGVITVFQNTGMDAAAFKSAILSEEFLALPKVEQSKLHDYMFNRVKTGERERDAEIEREERNKAEDPEALWITGQYLLDADKLAMMSDNELIALDPAIGKVNRNKLFTLRTQAREQGRRAKIDEAIEKETLFGLEPAQKNRASAIMASKLMDWSIDHPGSVPTEEEQRAIAASAREVWVTKGFFGRDEEERLELTPEEELEAVPKVFADVFPEAGHEQLLDAWGKFTIKYRTAVAEARRKGHRIPPVDIAAREFRKEQEHIKAGAEQRGAL